MRIVTLRYLKQNAATLDVSEPLIVTQNGQPAYEIEFYDDRIRRDESIALLTLMTLSEQDLERGRTFNRKALRTVCDPAEKPRLSIPQWQKMTWQTDRGVVRQYKKR